MARNALRFVFVVAVCGGLMSCGGGGGSSTTSATPTDGAKSVAAQVSLDSSVPASLGSAITQVVTPAGSAPYGSPVSVWTNGQNGQTLVLALDASGNVLAASTEASSSIKLSATSTATTLVRLAIGDLASVGSPASAIDAAITAEPTFGAFVAAVSGAMGQGVAPMDAPTVQQLLGPLVGVVLTTVRPAAIARARAQAVEDPKITTPLPAPIVPNALGFPVEIVGSNVGTVSIANRMPIPWDILTYTINGDLLQTTSRRIGARSKRDFPASNVGFNILAEQNDETRIEVTSDVLARLWKAVLEFAPTASCNTDALKAAIQSIVSSAPAPLSVETFTSSIKDFVKPENVLKNSIAFGKSCTYGDISKILQPFAKMVEVWSKIQSGVDVASALAEASFYARFFNASISHGVCESADSNIINCAEEYSLTPSPLYLAPKAVVTATLTAKDIRGTLTLPGGGLTSTTSSIAAIDPKTYVVTATAVGSVTLSLTDPATNKRADLPVTVVIPKVSPATVTVAPGKSFTLQMTDGQGHLVTTPPGTTWSVSGPNASDVQAFSLLDSNIATWIVNSTATTGSLTVTANAPDGFAYSATSKAEITIATTASAWRILLRAQTCVAPDNYNIACASTMSWGSGSDTSELWLTNSNEAALNSVYKWQWNDGTSNLYSAQQIAFNDTTSSFTLSRRLNYFYGYTYRADCNSNYETKQFSVDESHAIEFKVTQRSASALSGTFSTNNTYAKVVDQNVPCAISHLVPAKADATGTWTATRSPMIQVNSGDPEWGCGYIAVPKAWVQIQVTNWPSFVWSGNPPCSLSLLGSTTPFIGPP